MSRMRVDSGFREFYEREFRAVFRASLLLCRDSAAAEDATQEAFARALERWDRLVDKDWAGGWVMSTAINLGKRALRRRPRPALPSVEASDLDARLDLWIAVARLPLRQQQAVVLYYGADLSVRDVAKAMDCREGTARAHLARARTTLEVYLGGEIDAAGRAAPRAD